MAGVLFLGLTLLRVREMILDAVPASLKAAIAAYALLPRLRH